MLPAKQSFGSDHFARHLAGVPAILVLCAETSGLHPTDTGLDRLSVVGGASIYPTMQNLCLALRARGVGSAVTTLLCAVEPQVRELLAVPDDHITAAHVAVGYPAKPFPRRLTRTPVEEITFDETFGRPLFAGASA